ncbi:MAG: histidine phosphatase family protein [Gemmatimonadota bacterium]|nr:histidine phosphatase family protein [Gemmatimonadota bacterium]
MTPTRRGRIRLLLTAASLLVTSPILADGLAGQDPDAKVVILARHAEKLGGDDPALSEAGIDRAETLAHVLSRWPVDAIYTSQFRRTRDTAAPLAAASGVEAEVVDARDMGALLERIDGGEQQAIVVIGHSNTVPAIARALGAPGVEDIPEEGYDDLLVVTVAGDGTATLLHLKYGAPTPY